MISDCSNGKWCCRWNVLLGTCLATIVVVLLVPATAYAQPFHGATIAKSCQAPKVSCDGDEDCDNGDVCDGLEECDPQNLGNTLDCRIQVSNTDGFLDTIEVQSAWDVVDPNGINVREGFVEPPG